MVANCWDPYRRDWHWSSTDDRRPVTGDVAASGAPCLRSWWAWAAEDSGRADLAQRIVVVKDLEHISRSVSHLGVILLCAPVLAQRVH